LRFTGWRKNKWVNRSKSCICFMGVKSVAVTGSDGNVMGRRLGFRAVIRPTIDQYDGSYNYKQTLYVTAPFDKNTGYAASLIVA
jgi:hypothetical protein